MPAFLDVLQPRDTAEAENLTNGVEERDVAEVQKLSAMMGIEDGIIQANGRAGSIETADQIGKADSSSSSTHLRQENAQNARDFEHASYEDTNDSQRLKASAAPKVKSNATGTTPDPMLLDEELVANQQEMVLHHDYDPEQQMRTAMRRETEEPKLNGLGHQATVPDRVVSPSERSICMICEQRMEGNPDIAFATHQTCLACGNEAHNDCLQEYNESDLHFGSDKWLCPRCVEMERHSGSPEEKSARPRSAAPRLVRDLLPVTRGVQKKDSHSIFAQPLISEERDLTGFRNLRKRKSDLNESGETIEKRRRWSTPPDGDEHKDGRQAEHLDIDELSLSPVRGPARSTRRASQKNLPTVRIVQHRPLDRPPARLILAFRLDQARIADILAQRPKPKRGGVRRRPPKIQAPLNPVLQSPPHKFPALPPSNFIFPSILHDRDHETNSKPYGGILSGPDADTSRSLPGLKDREIFEIARKEAEEERRKASLAAEDEIRSVDTQNLNPPPSARHGRTISGPPNKIKCIQFGRFIIDTFYAAPYPEEYSHEARLFICEFCLKYLPSEAVAYRHKLKCPSKHPPGDEIYRDGSISIWEVDGRKKTEYCQCLCLMAKMFLGSKTLYYDVEPFLFYILTENDELGYHFVGYFSKEKRPQSLNNVSCILVMPIHQRKGYATFLIDFSYLLTRLEGKEGSPEKPLSDMGLTAYRAYWDLTIARHLLNLKKPSPAEAKGSASQQQRQLPAEGALTETKIETTTTTPPSSDPSVGADLPPISGRTLIELTGMTADDVIHSLERLYAFVRDPVTKAYGIRYDCRLYERIVRDNEAKGYRQLRPDKLIWTPYVMGRSDSASQETHAMPTVQPREGLMEEQSRSWANVGDERSVPTVERSENASTPRLDVLSPPAEPSLSSVEQSATIGESVTELSEPKPPPVIATTPKSHISVQSDEPKAIESDVGNGEVNAKPSGAAYDDSDQADNTHSPVKGITDHAGGATEKTMPTSDTTMGPTGYALTYRTQKIPPSRFQIDPPIPSSILSLSRGQSRRRNLGNSVGASATRRSNRVSPAMLAGNANSGDRAGFGGSRTPSVRPTGARGMNVAVQVRSSPRRAANHLNLDSAAESYGGANEQENDDGWEEETPTCRIPRTRQRKTSRSSFGDDRSRSSRRATRGGARNGAGLSGDMNTQVNRDELGLDGAYDRAASEYGEPQKSIHGHSCIQRERSGHSMDRQYLGSESNGDAWPTASDPESLQHIRNIDTYSDDRMPNGYTVRSDEAEGDDIGIVDEYIDDEDVDEDIGVGPIDESDNDKDEDFVAPNNQDEDEDEDEDEDDEDEREEDEDYGVDGEDEAAESEADAEADAAEDADADADADEDIDADGTTDDEG